jgi:hypothetical protein
MKTKPEQHTIEQKTWLDRPTLLTIATVVSAMAVGTALKQPILQWMAGAAGVVEFITWVPSFVGVGASRTLSQHEADTNTIESKDSAEQLPE